MGIDETFVEFHGHRDEAMLSGVSGYAHATLGAEEMTFDLDLLGTFASAFQLVKD